MLFDEKKHGDKNIVTLSLSGHKTKENTQLEIPQRHRKDYSDPYSAL